MTKLFLVYENKLKRKIHSEKVVQIQDEEKENDIVLVQSADNQTYNFLAQINLSKKESESSLSYLRKFDELTKQIYLLKVQDLYHVIIEFQKSDLCSYFYEENNNEKLEGCLMFFIRIQYFGFIIRDSKRFQQINSSQKLPSCLRCLSLLEEQYNNMEFLS